MEDVLFDGVSHQLPDVDPSETKEWLDAFDDIVAEYGEVRARYLLLRLLERAGQTNVGFPTTVSTPYVNTIPTDDEPEFPGDEYLERRIRAYIRWNAAVMVVRANIRSESIGGHLSTYASSAALYEVGFNHFFRGKDGGRPGDQVYFQGHASPGIYARAFVEGRLTERDLDNFRFEVGKGGLSSYPHPRLMPEFWEYPTVSMGLGPINAIGQAHISRYLQARDLIDASESRVWCFVGDGEFDEPETIGSLGIAGREHLDNLIFVVNCNLQRLDGPVRGNGKIIQELEALLRGAGWNVIKVIWGRTWDDLLAKDVDGVLLHKMNTTVDGEFQKYATESGAYIREHFFGSDPRLTALVSHLSDEELQTLPRGGHDYRKLYAAYKAATDHVGAPTAILAKTVKGWTLGPDIEARNSTHQIKKMTRPQLLALRDRLFLHEEIPDQLLDTDLPPYYRPPPDAPAARYLAERRRVLGGALPRRVVRARPLEPPSPQTFADLMAGSGKQSVSTTMAFARLLRSLVRDPKIGRRVVPIVCDELRTFGLESLISEVHIYAPEGQRYTPVDAGLALHYAESAQGQVLEEGITEAGATATFTAAATSYSTWGQHTIPCYLFYSMFGFQRVGDLLWSLGDSRGRGILCGCTAGRTTLNGEGLQHQDGHSLLLASSVPSVAAYDPAFAYELAVIVEDAIRRMTGEDPEDRYWYLTLYNENYPMPPFDPDGPRAVEIRDGIVRGLYRLDPPAGTGDDDRGAGDRGAGDRGADDGLDPGTGESIHRATILFSGTAWRAADEARRLLGDDWGVEADLWSATSYKALREEALSAERWSRLHPGQPARRPFVTEQLATSSGPIVAVTDFMRSVPDQVARWMPRRFLSLGTDGFGRSDTRDVLRRFFEIDAAHIVIAVLTGLAADGVMHSRNVDEAIAAYDVEVDAPDPWTT
jgi:pyruvate dehydrogenase E1 component